MFARISLTTIVQNEAASRGHCLASMRDVVEEIIAVDTGASVSPNRLTGLRRTSSSGDTITTSDSYDNADRLTNLTHTDATKALTLANYTYGYDQAGELTSYQDNNSSLTYGYDKTGQLLSAAGTLNGSNYSVSYSYDANGNRTMSGYSTGNDNELTSDGASNYTYDSEGNTLTQTNIATGSVTYYTWDNRNRLTEVKVEDSHGNVLNDETFTYDMFNNRIAVSLNGTAQLYTVYDGKNPYMDFNGSGTLTERYLANPGGLNDFYGEVSASGTAQWFLTDNIQSVRQVISTSGSVLDAITYDPYGNILNQTNAANAPRFLYTGGAYDAITGTYLDGAREDNPVDGRWLSQDPLGLGPDSNPYRYVGNDPTNAIDVTGLWKIKRDNQSYATATSDRGDTITGLARLIRLDPGQWEQWLSRDFGLESKVTLANGTKKTFLANPTSLKADDSLAAGQEFRIPNTVVMIWLGELRGYGKILSGWSGDYRYFYRRGFRVKELLFGNDDAINDIHDTIIKTFDEELRHMDKGETYGIYVIGHGGRTGIGRKIQCYEQAVTYAELTKAIGYQIGFGIFNVCNGAFGRRIVSAGGFFYGIYGLFIPQPFPFNDTKHSSDLLAPGAVGTNR